MKLDGIDDHDVVARRQAGEAVAAGEAADGGGRGGAGVLVEGRLAVAVDVEIEVEADAVDPHLAVLRLEDAVVVGVHPDLVAEGEGAGGGDQAGVDRAVHLARREHRPRAWRRRRAGSESTVVVAPRVLVGEAGGRGGPDELHEVAEAGDQPVEQVVARLAVDVVGRDRGGDQHVAGARLGGAVAVVERRAGR